MKTTQFFLMILVTIMSVVTGQAQEMKHCGSTEAERSIRE